MEKIFKENLKKITALLLSVSMIMSMNSSAFAQDVIVMDEIALDETIIVEDSLIDDTNDIQIAEEILVDEYADVAVVNSVGDINAEERAIEEARERECMPGSPDYLKKLLTYLSLKYPNIDIDPENGANSDNANKMASQQEYNTIEIDGNDEGYTDLTKNMVQFKYLGNFGGNIGLDGEGKIVYSNTVKTLIIKNVDEIRNLYVPASVETLIIENTTLNCYYYDKDSPGFQCGMLPGDLQYCENLKKLVLKNVKFGDNYKKPELEIGTWGRCPYETNYRLNLQNCHNLEELEIDVSFDGVPEVQLAIDGGIENLFASLTDEKCRINPAPGTGNGQVILYANKNSNLAKHYGASEVVRFTNEQFRRWLSKSLGIDTNHDGVISQAEMDVITSLTINDRTARSIEQTSLSDFQELADIEKMHGLKTLELDFYDPSYTSNGNRQPLKGIDFPDSLENLSMKNIYWEKDTQTKSHENADIVLTNLKTLEMYNTDVKVGEGDSFFNHSTQIKLEDTEGVLQSCIIERTDVESIELINNSKKKGIKDQDEKQRIRFSASDCQKLKSVDFLGEGYAVEGSLDLTNDKELTHIGIPNDSKSQWIVYGEFDMTYAPVNVILNGCTKLGSDCAEIVIDYDFVSRRDLNVQAMDTNFGETNKLTIKRQPRLSSESAGKVYLSCDKDKWLYNKYIKETDFVIEQRSSFPTIAVFSNGQRIRTSGEGDPNSGSIYTKDSNRWVERWNLVMQPGGYSNDFGNLAFYVVDSVPDPNNSGTSINSLRKVFYTGDVYVEWDKQNTSDSIITLPTTKDGETGGYKLTGSKLLSTGKPGEVELKLYVYEKNSDGTFKTNVNGDKIKSYIGYQNIKIFKMPDSVELVNDGTNRGSGTKDDPYIIGKNEELRLKARLMVDGDVDRSGDYALRDVYWRIKEYDETPKYTSDSDGYSLYTLDSATKAGISVVRGSLDSGETEDQYDRKIDSSCYSHRRFNFDTVGTKFKIVAQSPYKYNGDGSDRVISTEVYVEYRKSGSSGGNPGGSNPSPSPVPSDPVPVDPIKDPDKPTPGVPVKPEKNQGEFVMPDPTKNEVVYKAPPADETKKTITIPDKIIVDGKEMPVVKIDPGAFKNNENVKSINVGKNITVIGNGAFEGASNLTKITLGKNVETIGDGAFKDCSKLTAITIPSKTTEIGDNAFEGDKKLKKVKIGKNVESIGDGAFAGCKSLTSLSLPSKLAKIGIGAFEGCSKLTTIKIASKKLTSDSIDMGAFNGLTKKTTIKVPKSKLKTYKKLFKEKGINSKVKIKGY